MRFITIQYAVQNELWGRDMDLTEADQKEHPVETQWHYKILIEYGYIPKTKSQKGLVRAYEYTRPDYRSAIRVTTGCNADYWEDLMSGTFGYWGDLESHLKKIHKAMK